MNYNYTLHLLETKLLQIRKLIFHYQHEEPDFYAGYVSAQESIKMYQQIEAELTAAWQILKAQTAIYHRNINSSYI